MNIYPIGLPVSQCPSVEFTGPYALRQVITLAAYRYALWAAEYSA